MYNFDEIIDRTHTNALNTDGFRQYIFNADKNMQFPFKDEEFIRMWVADMEFATPEVIIDAIRERLDRRIFGYTELYEDNYYEIFSAWCRKRYGWSFAQEELVLSSGIVPALFDLVGRICKADEKVIFLTPSYAYFKYAAQKSNIEYVCSDMTNENGHYSIDFDDLELKASDPKTILFILCNPHNPSGRVFTVEELEKMAAIIEKYNLWVISDEIHCDLLRQNQTHTPLGKVMPSYNKLITCMAPSKTFNLAGMMISNLMIRNEDLRNSWNNANNVGCNPLSLAAAQAAYERGEHWLEALRVYLDKNFEFTRNYFAEHLPQAIVSTSEATYLGWVDLSSYIDKSVELPHFFAFEAGVLLEGGDMFVQNSDSCIRLNLASPLSLVKEGLKRICEAVKKHSCRNSGK